MQDKVLTKKNNLQNNLEEEDNVQVKILSLTSYNPSPERMLQTVSYHQKSSFFPDSPRNPQEPAGPQVWFGLVATNYWTDTFSFQRRNNQTQRTYICKGGSRLEGRPYTVQHLPLWDRT